MEYMFKLYVLFFYILMIYNSLSAYLIKYSVLPAGTMTAFSPDLPAAGTMAPDFLGTTALLDPLVPLL